MLLDFQKNADILMKDFFQYLKFLFNKSFEIYTQGQGQKMAGQVQFSNFMLFSILEFIFLLLLKKY